MCVHLKMTGVKFLKSVHSKNNGFNVRDHMKRAHTPIILHRVLTRDEWVHM